MKFVLGFVHFAVSSSRPKVKELSPVEMLPILDFIYIFMYRDIEIVANAAENLKHIIGLRFEQLQYLCSECVA